MKKGLSLLLSLLLLLLTLSSAAYAAPLADGTAALNRQFLNGQHGGYDYVYFSPVKEETDATKYPLMVWLHGRNSGGYARAQLERYEFSNWASDEYQARFENAGGCFLLAPRAAVGDKNEWDNSNRADLKAIIDEFIAQNSANVDVSRVYIAGYSTGGSMVWNMLTAYPGFFAAGLPLADLSMRLFREKSKEQLKLLGRAIEKMSFEADGRIAVMMLNRQDFEDCGALSEHADTVVNYGLETIGTQMAVLARESDDNRIKFSLRARAPLTVDDVAARLGGGGHNRAAGISMEGTLKATTRVVVRAMKERLQKEDKARKK